MIIEDCIPGDFKIIIHRGNGDTDVVTTEGIFVIKKNKKTIDIYDLRH